MTGFFNDKDYSALDMEWCGGCARPVEIESRQDAAGLANVCVECGTETVTLEEVADSMLLAYATWRHPEVQWRVRGENHE